MERVNLKEAKGITLVALVITVIILLILAGVALSLVIGENGLIAKSKTAVEKYKDKSTDEKWQLEDFEAGMEEISLAELEDEEKHPELKAMKLEIKVEEGNETIQLPVYTYEYEDYKYDFEVDWGDESEKQKVTNENLNSATHTYVPGIYTITVEGVYEGLYRNTSIKKSLIKVSQWGSTGLKDVYLEYCTNLTEIATPSKNSFVNVTDFDWTFNGCKSLQSIPERLFANCPNVTSFGGTFYGCSNLPNIPERLFANCPDVTSFSGTFSECRSLQSIPERLFANCPNVTSFCDTFYGCSNLPNIPERLFANCPNVTSFGGTFNGCKSLQSIPERLFANCPNVEMFNNTFSECTSLTSIPKNLFANCPKVESFWNTFSECTNLTGKSIQLWNEGRNGIDGNNGGEGCYYKCEKLEDYDTIPEYWKEHAGPV